MTASKRQSHCNMMTELFQHRMDVQGLRIPRLAQPWRITSAFAGLRWPLITIMRRLPGAQTR